MKKFISIYLLFLCAICVFSEGKTQLSCSDIKTDTTIVLNGVQINGSYIKRKDNYILALPTQMQRKHAHSGYDLVRNIMIPGISVNLKEGTIKNVAGNITLYINGREASYREVQSLRPKDIKNIEYHDMPTGKYAKDIAAINFILKDKTTGGYTQIDAEQGFGFLQGNYNIISKYSLGNTNLNLWAGYKIQSPDLSISSKEGFVFDNYLINRVIDEKQKNEDNIDKYIQASISHHSNKFTGMLRVGLSYKNYMGDTSNGLITYSGAWQHSLPIYIQEKNKNIVPSLYLYGIRNLTNNQTLDATLDSYYSRNSYFRNFNEQINSYSSDVNEDYFYTKFNANYTLKMKHNNQFALCLYDFLRISQSSYKGTPSYWQHLHSSETILFVDYSQHLGKKFYYDLNPGISYLFYKLHGNDKITHITPRFQISMSYILSDIQRLQFNFALGNTYPNLNTINNVDQRIDELIINRGNANMDNSIILWPRLSYSIYLNKLSLNASALYMYYSNAIVNNYYTEGKFLINSFRSDASCHSPAFAISASYKPCKSFNVKVDGGWEQTIMRGCLHQRQNTWTCTIEANYYLNNLEFSASCVTPQNSLVNYQFLTKTAWEYAISVDWNQGDLGIEFSANNAFLHHNITTENLMANVYNLQRETKNDCDNQYATIKLIYSFDYGKKTSKSPSFKNRPSESAILRNL